ncbi:MAG: YidH family protein [Solirubrobacterales bacterium]
MDEARDATRRTRLANERTQLAWWRTGLTALAVAVGIGRVIPELDPSATRWPYTVIGSAFAVYGVVLMAYGSSRGRAVEAALDRGEFAELGGWMMTALTLLATLLGLAVVALIIFD